MTSSQIKSQLFPAPQAAPKSDLLPAVSIPVSQREEHHKGLVVSLPGCLDHPPSGFGRAATQYTGTGDRALVPRVCESGVTAVFLLCMRLRSTLSPNTLFVGSNLLEQNHPLLSNHLFISNRVRKRDRKSQSLFYQAVT